MKICLNMIVKDEAHVIEETLENIKDYLSFWVVSDTGSSDNTKEIISSFFSKHSIPGELVEHEWEDFGTNRTLALQSCFKHRKKFDYIWVFDADDLVIGDFQFPKIMKEDFYSLKYGEGFTYMRSQVFKSTEKWEYVGVLHEFPRCVSKKNPTKGVIGGNYYIDSRRLGARNKNEDKYLRDAKVLEKGLEKEPDNTRYMFYLGQSYMDHGDYDKAIEWYTKRAKAGGWVEEVYYSIYRVATCMRSRGDEWEKVEKVFLNAWKCLPSRVEPLYEIAKYYREEKNFKKGYIFAKQGSLIPYPENQVLFLFKEIYDYKILDELSVCAYYLSKHEEAFDLANEILKKKIPGYDRHRIQQNRDLNIKYLVPIITKYPVEKIIQIRKKKKGGVDLVLKIDVNNFEDFSNTINSFLYACLDYLEIDEWICLKNNISKEELEKIGKLYPFFKFSEEEEFKWICNLRKHFFFEKRNYITESLELFKEQKNLEQIVFSKFSGGVCQIGDQEYIFRKGLPSSCPNIIKKDKDAFVSISLDSLVLHEILEKEEVQETESEEEEDENWIIVSNKDSFGNDIASLGDVDVEILKETALADPECVCFNTMGYLKNKLDPKEKWIHLPKPGFKMYIKKGIKIEQ